jgi:hypothetical protein
MARSMRRTMNGGLRRLSGILQRRATSGALPGDAAARPWRDVD